MVRWRLATTRCNWLLSFCFKFPFLANLGDEGREIIHVIGQLSSDDPDAEEKHHLNDVASILLTVEVVPISINLCLRSSTLVNHLNFWLGEFPHGAQIKGFRIRHPSQPRES